MKIPEDQKYWNVCASICLISTITDYLAANEEIISELAQIQEALNDARKFDLKEDSIIKLLNSFQIGELELWGYLYNFLYHCKLHSFIFYREKESWYFSLISYSSMISEHHENKPFFLVEIEDIDKPEILIEKDYEKFLLVSVFSDSQKIMYYFKKNSWFVLGNKNEKMVTFTTGMYLLYIKIGDSKIKKINYAKHLRILDNKNYYGEEIIEYVENFSNFLMQEIKNSQNQKIVNQAKIIEKLTIDNKALNEALEKKCAEIEMQEQLRINKEESEIYQVANKELKEELKNEKKKYELLLFSNEKLKENYNNLLSNYAKFNFTIRQTCDEYSKVANDYLSIQNHQQYDPSIVYNFYQKDSEDSIFPNKKLGIPNIGNTCYLNSVLQIFASTNKLYEIISKKADKLSITLSKVLSLIRKGTNESLSPQLRSLKSEIDAAFPEFLHWDQQDAKELLVALLGFTLDEATKSFFSFSFIEEFPCRCGKQSIMPRYESLLVIPSSEINIGSFFEKIKRPKNIEGGLKCDFCSENSITQTKIIEIQYPPYIILYLPKPERGIQISFKPLEDILELNGQIYYLYGVICHYEMGNGGHYTAFTRHKDQWIEYNDSIVENKAFDQNSAYLVFYSIFS